MKPQRCFRRYLQRNPATLRPTSSFAASTTLRTWPTPLSTSASSPSQTHPQQRKPHVAGPRLRVQGITRQPLRRSQPGRKVHSEFERAVQLDPENVQAMSDLGEYYVAAPALVGGGLDKAQALAARMQPKFPAQSHRLLALSPRRKKSSRPPRPSSSTPSLPVKHPMPTSTSVISTSARISPTRCSKPCSQASQPTIAKARRWWTQPASSLRPIARLNLRSAFFAPTSHPPPSPTVRPPSRCISS